MKYQGITIFKRPNCNSWYARYRANGKQFYVSARTQKDCYNKLKITIRQRAKGQILTLEEPKQEKSITLIEWFNKWLDLYKKELKESTKQDYKSSFKHLKELYNLSLNKITSIQILEQLNKINFARKKQKVYELLKDIFTKAKINDLVNNNPLEKINKPKYKKINGIAFSNEDETKLIQILKEKQLDMFLVCLYQGLRRGEMLALTIDDIDFVNNTIKINKSINNNDKIDTTKNEYSNRFIPLFNQTKQILEKYKNVNGRIFNIKRHRTEDIFSKIVKENFDKKYTIHSLRHTFITNCQEKQIPLHIIQKWVGHNIGSNVTNQIYTHTRECVEAENIEKMNK